MRIGIIDIGTNSVRLDIHEVDARGKSKRLFRDKIMVRLGQNLFESGSLHPEACARTLRAMQTFAETCKLYRVDRIAAVGTCALREARNSKEFVAEIDAVLRAPVRVVSGKEEATLILRGILHAVNLPEAKIAFIDIGGGSTEVGIADHGKLVFLESFALGAARLKQKFLRDEPSEDDITRLHEVVRDTLAKAELPDAPHKFDMAVGTSGTAKSVLKVMQKAHGGNKIKKSQLLEFITAASKLSQEEIISIPGVEARRADIILPGAVILYETMSFLGISQLRYINVALRDGILLAELEDMPLTI